jgi:ring-1,2-phenylacetyl-CoA epoxidase subunit PaaC
MPYALGIFEKSEYEDVLIKEGVFGGEEKLQEKWLEKITAIVTAAGLTLPKVADSNIVYGGRKGYHSKYLEPLLDEMTEVTRSDPGAEW